MLINCNSCEKKFIVPDNAITEKGRLVQCSSCGNKWTQYPSQQQKSAPIQVVTLKEKTPVKTKVELKKITKINKPIIKNREKKTPKYSKEYLLKKHGISLRDKSETFSFINNKSKGFGFYSWVIFIMVFAITVYGILNQTRDILVYKFPYTETYIEYFYEVIATLKSIILQLILFF